jgi:hypothetical protein
MSCTLILTCELKGTSGKHTVLRKAIIDCEQNRYIDRIQQGCRKTGKGLYQSVERSHDYHTL